MFSIGELVVYGNMGVCEVKEIKVPDMMEKLCYILEPKHMQGGKVYTPVDNQKVSIRKVLSKEEARELIEKLPQVEAFGYRDKREFQTQCRNALQSGELEELVSLTKALYNKKQERNRKKGDLSYTEREAMARAERILFGELATALEIPVEQVSGYISHQLTA